MSDRGPQFTSQVWNSSLEKLGATVSLTSGYHPQASGQVEMVNQEVGQFLKNFCTETRQIGPGSSPGPNIPKTHYDTLLHN